MKYATCPSWAAALSGAVFTTFHPARPRQVWSRLPNWRATLQGSQEEVSVPTSPIRLVCMAGAESSVSGSSRLRKWCAVSGVMKGETTMNTRSNSDCWAARALAMVGHAWRHLGRRAQIVAQMGHLALLDQVPHGACDILDGDLRVDAVLIEQVDDIGAQPLERSLGHGADDLGAAVDHAVGFAAAVPAEFGDDGDLPRHWR
jgi:hypothetical protein